jgi:hypothetical protein
VARGARPRRGARPQRPEAELPRTTSQDEPQPHPSSARAMRQSVVSPAPKVDLARECLREG